MRHVVNHSEFTENLKSFISHRGYPLHVEDYALTVVRKHFLKNWDKTLEAVVEKPTGVPKILGLTRTDDETGQVTTFDLIPIIVRTSNGSKLMQVNRNDPFYQGYISNDENIVLLDMNYLVEVLTEVKQSLDWLHLAYPTPRKLVLSYPDLCKKKEEWEKEERRKKELTAKQEKDRIEQVASTGECLLAGVSFVFESVLYNWKLVKLVTRDALYAESVRLHHCVDTYWWQVERGCTEIWSLRDSITNQSILTLEVTLVNGKRIHLNQCLGLLNREPSKLETFVLEKVLTTNFGLSCNTTLRSYDLDENIKIDSLECKTVNS